jgi:hypothetical protein
MAESGDDLKSSPWKLQWPEHDYLLDSFFMIYQAILATRYVNSIICISSIMFGIIRVIYYTLVNFRVLSTF